MPFWIPALYVEQHQIDILELCVTKPVAQTAVGVQGCVNSHLVCCSQQLHREPILHQGFAAAQGEATRHNLKAVPVLSKFVGRSLQGDRNSIGQIPRVWVMAVLATKLATGRPRYNADTRAINGGTGCEGMKESHLAGCEGATYIDLPYVSTRVYSQFKRALRH